MLITRHKNCVSLKNTIEDANNSAIPKQKINIHANGKSTKIQATVGVRRLINTTKNIGISANAKSIPEEIVLVKG